MANKVKVDLGSNSYNITMIGDFKDSVKRFASSTKSQCMLITQKNIFDLYKKQFDELSNISNINIFGDEEKTKSFDSTISIVNEIADKRFDNIMVWWRCCWGQQVLLHQFMKGKYIRIVTLLAMVDLLLVEDEINLEDGKNLVGRIYQP